MRVLIIALALLIPGFALGRPNPQPVPVQISNVAATPSAQGETITFSMTNLSGKDIRGLVVCVLDEKMCVTRVWGIMGPSRPASFKAGQVISGRMKGLPLAPDKIIVTYPLSLDYVLYSDGSSGGPNKTNHYLAIMGFLNGHRMTLIGLREMLKKNGPDAVVNYIEGQSGSGY